MKKQNLDGFIVPHDDEYQNEYIPAYAERLMWATGFSGSAGAAIIMQDQAVMLTDGRYTLQVREQTDASFFSYADITETSPDAWLLENASKATRIGYDPMLHTLTSVKRLKAAASQIGFDLVAVSQNPIDLAWTDQPSAPQTPIQAHDLKYAGKSSNEKRHEIATVIRKAGADAALITAPPSLAWLFNIRGHDVARSPLPLGRALLDKDGNATLFVAPEKVGNELPGILGDDVDIRSDAEVTSALMKLGKSKTSIAVDPALAPSKYIDDLREAGATIVELTDPCAVPRASKNETEIEGARSAHIRDGAAVTQFLYWLDTEAQSGEIDEITAAMKLEEIRSQSDDLRDLSFDTISGAGSNGAICHYKVSTESNIKLGKNTLYLVDSGGQYYDGTTDITRTVPIGQASEEMCDRFTRVLKGHIALAQMKFPTGTTGHQLDAIARKPLWDVGLDYDHGTGHGVGSFLGVHEGPQRIAKAPNSQALKPGMILSNEPGFYKAGEFGIRIENLIVVTPPTPVKGGEREMMEFETITLAPINLDLVMVELLTAEERDWLNQYHTRVRQTLGPLISADIKGWFENATRQI
ncbi:aminopeptidase P family protein [Hyphococcus lacteus]|uniref:Aminopeptidase P family protein n=1 Tax=Hyphococcus lacteus TaxID=3143536 RepID=A0ABV3Z4C3_9PROT